MSSSLLRSLSLTMAFISALALSACQRAGAGDRVVHLPDPVNDLPHQQAPGQQTAVFAAGCFWGVQAVFQHVKGVVSATSGYSGGAANKAKYEMVSTGTTGHAESVKVVYDPAQISYGQLLKILLSVAHDPTELNRQGPDIGTQYRSAIFYTSEDQRKVAEGYIEQLQSAHVYSRPIVTQVVPLQGFYEAEAYHQDYATRHPSDLYIAINDLPKVANLKTFFPNVYRPGIAQ